MSALLPIGALSASERLAAAQRLAQSYEFSQPIFPEERLRFLTPPSRTPGSAGVRPGVLYDGRGWLAESRALVRALQDGPYRSHLNPTAN
jgi:hypothetical protein